MNKRFSTKRVLTTLLIVALLFCSVIQVYAGGASPVYRVDTKIQYSYLCEGNNRYTFWKPLDETMIEVESIEVKQDSNNWRRISYLEESIDQIGELEGRIIAASGEGTLFLLNIKIVTALLNDQSTSGIAESIGVSGDTLSLVKQYITACEMADRYYEAIKHNKPIA